MEKQTKSNKWIICRICLKASDSEMFPIFGEGGITTGLAEQIADYGSIALTYTRTTPDQICEGCLLLLKAARKFRKLCQRSAQQWQELIQLNAKTPEMKNKNTVQLIEVLDGTNYAENPTDATESEKSLEVLEEQQNNDEDTADSYVFEVVENGEEDCVDADENMLASHGAQFIELDGDDNHMDFLEDNSTENSVELTYYSQSQFEVLKQGETLATDEHISKLLDDEQQLENTKKDQPETAAHQDYELEIGTSIVSEKEIKRVRKKTTDKKKKSKRNKDKDDEDSQNDWPKKATNNYICSFCGNVYNEKAKLTLHLRIHTKEKPHECEICHKRFAQTPQLTRHMNSHTGNRPFKCKFCEASFADPSTCIKHQRIHTQERPYVCETCGKAFSYSNVLKVHVMSHTGEKPYNCKYCDKKFTQAHHKRTHERIHT